jgi:hypothetical protein
VEETIWVDNVIGEFVFECIEADGEPVTASEECEVLVISTFDVWPLYMVVDKILTKFEDDVTKIWAVDIFCDTRLMVLVNPDIGVLSVVNCAAKIKEKLAMSIVRLCDIHIDWD